MLQRKLFHFQADISSLAPVGGGQLSFLPLGHHYRIADGLDGIFMELDECVLLFRWGMRNFKNLHERFQD